MLFRGHRFISSSTNRERKDRRERERERDSKIRGEFISAFIRRRIDSINFSIPPPISASTQPNLVSLFLSPSSTEFRLNGDTTPSPTTLLTFLYLFIAQDRKVEGGSLNAFRLTKLRSVSSTPPPLPSARNYGYYSRSCFH